MEAKHAGAAPHKLAPSPSVPLPGGEREEVHVQVESHAAPGPSNHRLMEKKSPESVRETERTRPKGSGGSRMRSSRDNRTRWIPRCPARWSRSEISAAMRAQPTMCRAWQWRWPRQGWQSPPLCGTITASSRMGILSRLVASCRGNAGKRVIPYDQFLEGNRVE